MDIKNTNLADIRLPAGRWVLVGRGKVGHIANNEEFLVQLCFVRDSFFLREMKYNSLPLSDEVIFWMVAASQIFMLHPGTVLTFNDHCISSKGTNAFIVNRSMALIALDGNLRKSMRFQTFTIKINDPRGLSATSLESIVGSVVHNTVLKDLSEIPCFCVKEQVGERQVSFIMPCSEVVRHFFLNGTNVAKRIFCGGHLNSFDPTIAISNDENGQGKMLTIKVDQGFTKNEVKIFAKIATISGFYSAAQQISSGFRLKEAEQKYLEPEVLDCGYLQTVFPADGKLEVAVSGYFIDFPLCSLFVVNQIHTTNDFVPFDSVCWIPRGDVRQWKNEEERKKRPLKKNKRKRMSKNEPPSEELSITSQKSGRDDSQKLVYNVIDEDVVVLEPVEEKAISIEKAEKMNQAFRYSQDTVFYKVQDSKISVGEVVDPFAKGIKNTSKGEVCLKTLSDFGYIRAVCCSLRSDSFILSFYSKSEWISIKDVNEIMAVTSGTVIYLLLQIEKDGYFFYLSELFDGKQDRFHMTGLFYDPALNQLKEVMVTALSDNISKCNADWESVKDDSLSFLKLHRFNHKKKTVESTKKSVKKVNAHTKIQKVDSVKKVGKFINKLISDSKSLTN